MIKWLQNYGGYSSTSLTIDEKSELSNLRQSLQKYRKYEEHEKNFKDIQIDPKNKNKKFVPIQLEENEEEEEIEKEDSDINEDFDDEDYIKKHVANKPRKGICGKVHGTPHPKKPDEKIGKKNNNNEKNEENKNYIEENNKKTESQFKPKIYQKSPEIKEKIKTSLLKSILFNNLDQKDLELIINSMEEKKFAENTEIVKQNEITENVYLVFDGKLEAFKSFENKQPHLAKELQKGDLFNEISVLYNHKNPATIKTTTETILYTIDRENYVAILKEANKNKNNYNENILNKIEIFSTLEPNELNLLANNFKISNYYKGDYIYHSGEYGDVFYYIEKGKLTTYKKTEPGKIEIKEKELNEKEFFGEKSLLNGSVRENSIIVTSDCATLIGIDKETVNNLIGPLDEILKRNMEIYNKYFQYYI
jgi:CRP-like cAMP-binding protein